MLGKTALFVPGFDHAGISTQSVVEKRLYKSSGRTRHDLGREKFVETVWDWKNEYQVRITDQLQRLGGSYDWSRVAFTMDEVSTCVTSRLPRSHLALLAAIKSRNRNVLQVARRWYSL